MRTLNIIAALLSFVLFATSTNAAITVNAGYETGLENDGDPNIGVVEPEPDRIETSQSFARAGYWSVRTELRYGDTTSVGVRAESNVRFTGDPATEPVVERGVNKFYGFSLMIDPTDGNFDYDTNGDILFQSKQTDSGPHFHFMTDEGKFKYVHSSHTQSQLYSYFEDYQKGVWYDFVLDHLPSYTSNGHLKFYYKKATDSTYTQVLDYSGATLHYDKDGYSKWGVYKGTWASNPTDSELRVVFHDNVRVATTFAEADPSQGNSSTPLLPPAIPENFTATAGIDQVSLNWDNNTDPDLDCYSIYRSTTSGGPYSWIASVSTSDYIDTGVTNGSAYYYVVTAIDTDNNESMDSNEATAIPGDWTQLTYDDFESGWGNWIDGGTDCLLDTSGSFAHQGTNAANLQDNSSTAMMTTNNLAASAYTGLKVEFWFLPVSFDNNTEDFWLQVSTDGGVNFTTVKTWAQSIDFLNDIFYSDTVLINGYTLTDQTQIRFRCDASGDQDDVYIDEVRISGLSSGSSSDTTPPTPDPLTWATLPYATGSTSISMTASTASDQSGVEYYFTCVSGGGNDSGWQSSQTYEDTNLSPNTTYSYSVKARDLSANQNETAASSTESATTDQASTPTSTHVDEIDCQEYKPSPPNAHGQAIVTVYDNLDNPVPNALVDGTFTGDFNETIDDVSTDANGQAVFTTTNQIKKPSFTFCVDDITHSTLTYDSSANEETCSTY